MWLRVIFWWCLAGLVRGTHRNVDSCNEVQQRCLYRSGCKEALSNYMFECADVVEGNNKCSIACQDALIVLISTEEGKNLMTCTCEDDYCRQTKQKVEICKAHVLRASRNETLSCILSEKICLADPECDTALNFYRFNCRSMFHGKKCSRRCHNSINVLQRTDKGNKLYNCRCSGFESYECLQVKDNMNRLCFHKIKAKEEENLIPTVVVVGKGSSCSTNPSVRNMIVILTFMFVVKYTTPS